MDCLTKTCPPKSWNERFLTDRNFKEEEPYVRMKSDVQSVFGGIENFMQDSEVSLPSDQIDDVVEFCQGSRPDDLRSGGGNAGRYRRAWLDDRKYSPDEASGVPRKYAQSPLTPSQLYKILQARRYDNAVMPDADRRLIYITKMSPHYMLALTETAPWHQVESLRDALWKYLASQISVRVYLPQNYSVFHLEFHLRYLSLQRAPREHQSQKVEYDRNWTDLWFLKSQKNNLHHYRIHEAQISFVIVGSDNYRWDGYCFAFDEEEDLLDDDTHPIFKDDPISWDGKSCRCDANRPIWDPRKYFLAVFESRMCQILAEFERLVRMIAKSINRYENAALLTLSQHPQYQAYDAKGDFERVQLIMRLLRHLINVLSKYDQAWENFSRHEGDLGYFLDIVEANDLSSAQARLSIEAIKQAFVRLRQCKRELCDLEDLCKNSARITKLQLQLTLAGSNSARNNEIVTGLTASIVNPIAVAAALFSMPDAVKVNPKPFVVAIIISVALMRLLMSIPGLFGWWPGVNARIKAIQWDPRAYMKVVTTQTRHGADEAIYDVEMHPVDNHACDLES